MAGLQMPGKDACPCMSAASAMHQVLGPGRPSCTHRTQEMRKTHKMQAKDAGKGCRACRHLLKEFFTRTRSLSDWMAGCMARGCSTVAPKKASSVASS